MPMDTGSGLANLMLGNFQSYNQNNAAIYPYFRFLAYEAYAQDSWKVSASDSPWSMASASSTSSRPTPRSGEALRAAKAPGSSTVWT